MEIQSRKMKVDMPTMRRLIDSMRHLFESDIDFDNDLFNRLIQHKVAKSFNSSNRFLLDRIGHNLGGSAEINYAIYIVLPKINNSVSNAIIRCVNDNDIPIPEKLVKINNGSSYNIPSKYTRKYSDGTIYCIHTTDVDYVIEMFKQYNVLKYILIAIPYLVDKDGNQQNLHSSFLQYIKKIALSKYPNIIVDSRIDTSTSATKTMVSNYSKYSGLSEDESRKLLEAKKEEIVSNNFVKINFRLTSSTDKCEKILFSSFEKGEILPTRLNWKEHYTNRTISGGTVLCPFDKADRFKNKMTLYGIETFRVSYSVELFLKYSDQLV